MFWKRKRAAADFSEEVRSHLQLDADDLESERLTAAEAQLAALRAFGNVTAAEERFYERHRLLWFDHLLQDVRYGLRILRQSPGFTIAAVLTLALGMGANTAIFSLINAVLLRSLPVQDPASLYFLRNVGARAAGGSPPYPCFERFRSQAKSFAAIAAFVPGDFGIRIDGPIEQVNGARVSANYYSLLGVPPVMGRLFTPDDERLDPPVAVISYQFWQRRFGGEAAAIGRSFSLDGALDGRRFVIVGVTPKEFHGLTPGNNDDVMMPITLGGPMLTRTDSWWFQSIARLKPGGPVEQARAELEPIFQAFMNEFPPPAGARRDFFDHMELSPAGRGMEQMRKRFSEPLGALMAVVGLVLLIACANITNLLLARAANREREFAVRVAIGAGRGRLFRQLLVETGLLFVAGAISGLVFAWWAVRGLTAFFNSGPQPILIDTHWDWRVLGFTAALCLLATLIFGAAPILRALRTDPDAAMKDGGRSTRSRGRVELGRMLVSLQVALSLVLLVGAVLFLRTLRNLYSADAGFRAEQVALVSIHLPDASYHQAAARFNLWDRLLPAVRSLPGVRSVGLSFLTPMDGKYRGVGFEAPGFQPRSNRDSAIGLNAVSEGYFGTLGTALLRGRDFTENDRQGAPNVAMINESAARHFFSGRDPLGAVVKINGRPCRIVGVVQDARDANLREAAERFVYLPLRQPLDQNAFMMLSIRTAADPRTLLAVVPQRIRELGPDIHIAHTGTLAEQLDNSLLQERLISTLAAAFGVLALLLSAVGMYGVLGYSVARRTPEIGIRVALGAMPGQVAWGIFRETVWLVGIGLAIGIPVSMWVAKLAGKLLYGVKPTDALTQAGAAALLAAVAFVASYLPARRAVRIDPLTALRHD